MNTPTKALLDTDTLSLLMRGHRGVREQAAAYLGEHRLLTFSQITRYEITRGLLAANANSQLETFEELCASSEVIPIDWSVLEQAARIWADLRRLGQMIEEADILIAATAIQMNLPVVTHNISRFGRVPGLQVTDWAAGS